MPRQVKTFTRSRTRTRPGAEARPGSTRPAAASAPERRWERIYAVVRRVPRGQVATYGQVAALAGLPRHARQVGYALNALPEESDVPWHRVVNARGEVSPRSTPGWEQQQVALLRRERVIGRDGRVDLERFRWEPGD